MLIRSTIKIIFIITLSTISYGQWSPTGLLAQVPVYENCGIVNGRVGISIVTPPPRRIYVCQSDINYLDRTFGGAGHFIYVHEFGHQVVTYGGEPAADCWASEQLVYSRNGEYYINGAIRAFLSQGDVYSPGYGTGRQRAQRVYNCATRAASNRPISRNDALSKSSFPKIMSSFEEAEKSGFNNAKLEVSDYKSKEGFEYLLEASLSQFISLRGDKLESEESLLRSFQGLARIEGFELCRAYGKSFGLETASYRCDLNVSNNQVQTKFNQFVTQIKALNLNSWKQTPSEENLFYEISNGEGKRTITLIVNDAKDNQKQISLWINSPKQEEKGQ